MPDRKWRITPGPNNDKGLTSFQGVGSKPEARTETEGDKTDAGARGEDM